MPFTRAQLQKFWEFSHPSSRDRERTILIITSLCLLISLVLSSNLWFRENRIFAPSPILPVLLKLPFWTDWALLGAAAVSVITMLAEPKRKSLAIVLPVVFVIWILQDSLRWQPFLYMYAFVFLAIFYNAFQRNKETDRLLLPLQLMIIGVYFWAGIGKINPYFHELIFPWFISPLIQDPKLATMLSYAVPVLEFLVGVFLIFPKLRKLGLILALGMLLVVLLCLGPLGHNWGMIVWPWNVFLFSITSACFIFNEQITLLTRQHLKRPLVIVSILLFWLLPLLGQFGYWGAHPSFKLYSGDIARGIVTISPDEDPEKLPPAVASAMSDEGVSLISWTINEFSIAATPSIPGYGMYFTGAKGLCRHLKKPEDAYLITEMVKLKRDRVKKTLSKVKLCL